MTNRPLSKMLFALTIVLLSPFALDLARLAWPSALQAQATAQRTATAAAAKPDDTRFNVVTLVPMGELDEPMTFAVAKDGRVFINERRTGHIKVYNPRGNTTTIVGTIPINHTYFSASGASREAEEGFHGLTLDPNFETNHWAYIQYADPDAAKHVLARIELRDETAQNGDPITRIVPNSHVTLLEFPAQRETCCHTGGGMTWDAQGNLYVTTGNNTGNTGTSQTDERPGRLHWDDQRGAANTNSLTGKILRITPQQNGTYTIPAGNLFPPGTPGTRPEIYTMGHRNVWRVSVDSRTGYVYWGEVGPDNQADNPNVGPRGYDELNQAKRPGFFGWPYFIGENRAFPFMDYVNGRLLEPKDPARPTNTSVNNTGLTVLPPAQPSFIGYEYGLSEKFPEVGTGGRCAVGGPIYHRADFAADAPRPWPAYYEGKWIATDCARAWIMAITMDQNSDYQSMERFLPKQRWSEPMDLKFGPTGDLYLLDYGSTWFAKGDDARLVRIEYNAGNRTPTVMASSSVSGGSVPFRATLSSTGTVDYDGDALQYEWVVTGPGGTRTFRQPSPAVSFDRAGVYTATLNVTDAARAKASAAVEIVAGNEPPKIELSVTGSLNQTFFAPGAPLTYAVKVSDKEDGAIAEGQVGFSINYVPEGFDVSGLAQGQEPVDSSSKFAVAKAMVAKSDCAVCHSRIPGAASLGPTLAQLAGRYQPDESTINQLAAKVRSGGTGVWGTASMPSHPVMSLTEARTIVDYFLRSGQPARASHPLTGTYQAAVPVDDNGRGAVVLRAVYTDKGSGRLPARTTESIKVLRSPRLGAGLADLQSGVIVTAGRGGGSLTAVGKSGSYVAFKAIDLTGLRRAQVAATAGGRGGEVGGTIELRLGSPTGEIIGQVTVSAGADAGAPAPPPGQGVTPAPGAAGRGAVAPGAPGGGRGAPTGAVGIASAAGFPASDRNTAPPATAAAAGRGGAAGAGGGAGAAGPGRGGAAPGPGGGGRAGGPAGPIGVAVDLRPTTGVHDVYVVFKNDRAGRAQDVATLTQVAFE